MARKKIEEIVAESSNNKKMQAIKKACAALQGRFGKESVNFLGNKKAEPLPRIPTGSVALDRIIGGGYPIGRMIEVFGPASSGKCLTKDTMILTAYGYKKLSDIFIENEITPFCTQKEVPVSYPLINMNGEKENTTHFVMNGKRTVYRTKTKHGAIINSTAKHPLRVLSKNGFPIWKFTSQLEPGDILIGRKGDKIFSSNDTINETEASILGLIIADGYLSDGRISMTNSDNEILDFYKSNINSIEEFKDINLHEYQQEGRITTELHLNSKEKIKEFYNRVNLSASVAKNKYIPVSVLNGSEKIQKAFLKTFIDCECFISESSIVISSASYNLINSIRLMLLNFGIESYLSNKTVKKYEQNEYFYLSIYSDNIYKYINEIGFFTTTRKEKANQIKIDNIRSNKIPNIGNLVDEYYASVDPCMKTIKTTECIHFANRKNDKYTADLLIRLLDNTYGYGSEYLYQSLMDLTSEHLLFDEVISVEMQNEIETFDFAMEKTHSFIAEGIINHNTTVCYHAIAEAQKAYPDKWCGFVDSEHSFDPEYAGNIGVNVSELIVAQPDSGTDAFGMVQGMIENGASLIVVDSVAAMVPREEMEEEDYGKNSIGTQARMMSKGLRKLTSIAGKYKCLLIFTNQIRNKIGIVYGSNQVTTGGRALQYYASIRLRTSQTGKIEETENGEKVVKAIETKITTVKNKCFAPYKSCQNVIVFGKGIDNDAGILDIAIANNIIAKKGGWYAINGTNVAQGLVNLKAYLENNKEIYETIKEKVKDIVSNEQKENETSEEEIDADNMTDDEIASKVNEENTDVESGEV